VCSCQAGHERNLFRAPSAWDHARANYSASSCRYRLPRKRALHVHSYHNRGHQLGSRLLREGLERAGGLWLDIRTRTEGYYERLGASRSFGYRLTREAVGLGDAAVA
jgi:hypothetical protein